MGTIAYLGDYLWRLGVEFAGGAASHFLFFCTLCRQFICRCLAINAQIFRNSALY